MTNTETIKAIDAEIKIQEAELQRLREERAAIVQEDRPTTDDQCLMDAVLSCPHSITHESVTLHFCPRQKEGHNALSQLRHRLAARAAGIVGYRYVTPDVEHRLLTDRGVAVWNPLADDGDALRLMVQLGFGIYRGHDAIRGEFCEISYWPRKYAREKSCIEYHKDHPNQFAATRRAIVRAASSIGGKL